MTITGYVKIRTQCDEIRRFPVFDYVTSTDYETPHPLERKSYTARTPPRPGGVSFEPRPDSGPWT